MQTLLKRSSQALTQPKTGYSQENTAIYTSQSMMSQHTCPCCSYTLLRHIHLAGVYWRCTHCYQEMPVYQLLPQLTSTLISRLKRCAI